jgi:hypothetical protein
MVDILLSSEELAVFGGPASIDLDVDFGPAGTRGSLILTGNGKPTDPDVDLPNDIQPFDLYINLNPFDFEYLFLYQYGSINGVLTWSRVLRLIPNTAIANLPVIFYNGEAVTFTPSPGLPTSLTDPTEINFDDINASFTEPETPSENDLWLDLSTSPLQLKAYVPLVDPATGLPVLNPVTGAPILGWVTVGTITPGLNFPVGDYFDLSEVIIPNSPPTPSRNKSASFNVQYVILNETPISSGLTLESLTEIGPKIYLPVIIKATETEPFNPLSEDVLWKKVTGIKNLSIVVTANIGTLDIDATTPEES